MTGKYSRISKKNVSISRHLFVTFQIVYLQRWNNLTINTNYSSATYSTHVICNTSQIKKTSLGNDRLFVFVFEEANYGTPDDKVRN